MSEYINDYWERIDRNLNAFTLANLEIFRLTEPEDKQSERHLRRLRDRITREIPKGDRQFRQLVDKYRVWNDPGYLARIGAPDGIVTKSFAERHGLDIEN